MSGRSVDGAGGDGVAKRARHAPGPAPLLVLSLEFTHSPFSGNGVLARSLVKGLLACGHTVHVICAKPAPVHAGEERPIAVPEVTGQAASRLFVHAIQLSPEAGWRRLDEQSGWREFIEGAARWMNAKMDESIHATMDPMSYRDLANEYVAVDNWMAGMPTMCNELGVSAAIAIDWSGGAAWHAMLDAWRDKVAGAWWRLIEPSLLYINFRVYSSGLDASLGKWLSEWYDGMESHVLETASHAIALSARDQASLVSLRPPRSADLEVEILLPCLRGDMEVLATQQTDETARASHLPAAAKLALEAVSVGGAGGGRRFVSCVVRASTEKNPLLIADLLEKTRLPAELSTRGLVPLVCACGPCADELQRRVRAAAPAAVVLDAFLGPQALAAVYSATALNLHPCTYDAYGMSLVEAAAFGAPSVVHAGGAVGATALLGSDGCVELDLTAPLPELASALLASLDAKAALEQTARVAREKALSWGEGAAGKRLSETVARMLERVERAERAWREERAERDRERVARERARAGEPDGARGGEGGPFTYAEYLKGCL